MKLSLLKHTKSIFFKGGMLPVYVILYVTSKCNLKCGHCFFHSSLNKPEEISIADIEKISKSTPNLLNLSLTGGEPFLRNDIEKIAALFAKNCNTAIISIPTNGMLPEKIVAKTRQMLEENPKTIFNVSVSVDGKRETHNRIRGSENAFSNACKTLAGLSMLRKKFGNLHLGIIYTLNGLNAKETVPVYKTMLRRFNINQFQINFLRGEPKEIKCPEELIKQYEEANQVIARDLARKRYKGYKIAGDFYTCLNKRYKQVLIDTVKEKKFLIPCYAGTTNCVIYPNADVFACEIRNDLFFGNLKDLDFNLRGLLSTKKNQKMTQSIRESRCYCTFECQLTSNVAFNAGELLKVLALWLKLKLGKS